MMLTGKVIPVELIEIRKEDGAQCYKDTDGDLHWISGWNRASNIKVGDKGKLIYETHPSGSWGLHFFHKDGEEKS